MSSSDFLAIAPLLVLALGATTVMLQIAFTRNLRLTGILAVTSLLLAAVSCISANDAGTLKVGALLVADGYSLLFTALFCLAGAVTCGLSLDYIQHHGDEPEEYFLLIILATMGAAVLAYAAHVASLLLGLELLSVSIYALIAYPNRSILPLEAASKYLVLSGAASATSVVPGSAVSFSGLQAARYASRASAEPAFRVLPNRTSLPPGRSYGVFHGFRAAVRQFRGAAPRRWSARTGRRPG